MRFQFEVPKLWAAFLLGNLAFSFVLSRYIHRAFGVVHAAFAFSVFITGFGGSQLYPFVYWLAALGLAGWALLQEENHQFFWRCLAVSGCLVAFHAYLQMMGFAWPLHYAPGIESTTPIAFLGQQTKLGAFLAPAAVTALALGWIPAFAFMSFIALATKSSFTAFALLLGFFVVRCSQVGYWHKIPALVFLGGLLLTLLGPRFGQLIPALDDHGRGEVYADLLKAWSERPLFGYGPGSFQEIFHQHFQSLSTRNIGGGYFLQAHNDYLQVLFEFGLAGFLPLLYALGAILCAFYVTRNPPLTFKLENRKSLLAAKGALACLLANALGNFPWLMAPHFLIGVVAAAILLRAARA